MSGWRQPQRWFHVAALVASMVAALHLAHPTPNIPLPTVQLPALTGGCAAIVPATDETTTIPVTINRSNGTVTILTTVCINGQGPFPFVVDSGAATSAISAPLTQHLGLGATGRSGAVHGVGCTLTAVPTRLSTWSWHGITLGAQTVPALAIPGFGVTSAPAGLLGADVLSRFGAVRIDFAQGLMTVVGPEGSPLAQGVHTSAGSSSLPAALTKITPQATAAMRVVVSGTAVQGTVPVSFGGEAPSTFVVDTGASVSAVDTPTATQAQLAPAGKTETQRTVCSVVTDQLVHTGTWYLGSNALPPSTVSSIILGLPGANGLLGSDVYATYGSIVIDFGHGELALGVG